MDANERGFEYLLNAFEQASQHQAPATQGYAEKRKALLAYVASLAAGRTTLSGGASVAELLREARPYAERIVKRSQAGHRTLDEMVFDMECVSDNARALLAKLDAALRAVGVAEQKDGGGE